MSGWGFDEAGRALDAEARDTDDEPDPFKLAARAQSVDLAQTLAALQQTPTTETLPDLLRHACALPDVTAALLDGPRPIWPTWLPVLEHARLNVHARRDLAQVAQHLPNSEKVQVLERVFRVPLGADIRAIDAVDDLLSDAAESPRADADSVIVEEDATLHLDGAEALVGDLFDGPVAVEPDALPAQEAMWMAGAERRVDVTTFIRACAPQVRDCSRAETVLNQRFGGGEPSEDDATWWRSVRRLRRRFPVLVDALEAAQDGRFVPVRGGIARVDLDAGSLGIAVPATASE